MLKKMAVVVTISVVWMLSIFQQARSEASVTVGALLDQRYAPIVSADQAPQCWPLDIVLLIDQSTSMYDRYPYSEPDAEKRFPPNDPDGYRFDAAKAVLDRLIFNRRYQCPDAVHRLGLITFGNTAKVALPMVQIDFSPETTSEVWASEYYLQIEKAATDRGQQATDFQKAFKGANDLLAQAPQLNGPEGYGPRRRVVIVLTDGNPAGVGDTQKYMCSLISSSSQDPATHLNSSAWQDIHLWLVALTATSGPYLDDLKTGCGGKTIRQNWQDVTRQHSGDLSALTYNEQTIPSSLDKIVQKEFGRPGVPITCGKPFWVEPYLQEIEFTFFREKGNADLAVTLAKLDDITDGQKPIYKITTGREELGTLGEMKLKDYKSNEGQEIYVFEFPKPGYWQFSVNSVKPEECQRRIDASKTSRIATARLVKPSEFMAQVPDAPYYDKNQPEYFAVELVGRDNQLVPAEDDYPLTITLNWDMPSGAGKLPDGTPLPSPIELSLESKTRWSYTKVPVLTPEIGTYPVVIAGTTISADRKTAFNVFAESQSYEAKHLEKFNFTLEAPQTDQVLYCNDIQNTQSVGLPIPLRIQLRDASQQPASRERYILPGDHPFQAELLDSNGNPIETITLTASSEAGVFEGELLEKSAAVVGCGTVEVAVSFTGDYDPTRYILPNKNLRTKINRVKREGVIAKIVEPQANAQSLLHASFSEACTGELQPVLFEIELLDLKGNRLDPTKVAANSAGDLYRVRLLSPDPKQWEDLRLEVQEMADGPVFVATGGLSYTLAGRYQVEVVAQPKGFNPEYVPDNRDTLKIALDRADILLTSPVTCQIATGAGVFLLLAVIGVIIYLLTGGPAGAFELVESLSGKSVAGPFRLPKRRFATIRNQSLKDYGIQSIQARKARPLETARAVRVKIEGSDKTVLANNLLEVDQPYSLGDVDIVYK